MLDLVGTCNQYGANHWQLFAPMLLGKCPYNLTFWGVLLQPLPVQPTFAYTDKYISAIITVMSLGVLNTVYMYP